MNTYFIEFGIRNETTGEWFFDSLEECTIVKTDNIMEEILNQSYTDGLENITLWRYHIIDSETDDYDGGIVYVTIDDLAEYVRGCEKNG